MRSAVDTAKRALVKVLKAATSTHGLESMVTRESPDKAVNKAFRAFSLRAHPDKGGDNDAYQSVTAAYDTWQKLVKDKSGVGCPRKRSEPERAKAARSYELARVGLASCCLECWFSYVLAHVCIRLPILALF